jgi:large subunit ribosomal protein L13
MGKNKPSYVPHIDSGAVVKVKNAAQLVLTGKKWETLKHFRTSGRPGGLKATLASTLRETNPGEVLKHAVKFMLPKNSTQAVRLKRLIIE